MKEEIDLTLLRKVDGYVCMDNMAPTLCADVGGTKTRIGLVDNNLNMVPLQQCQTDLCFTFSGVNTRATKENGFIVFATPTTLRYPTYSVQKLQKMLIAYIFQAIKQLQKDVPSVVLRSGAVSFAGIVKDNAVITKAADLWGKWGKWDETDWTLEMQPGEEFFLKEILEKKYPKMRWIVVNDVIAAAYRYLQLPQYQYVQRLGLLTISTGIGYALFNRASGDFEESDLVSLGHRIVDASNEALDCDCGGKGHLTAYFSGKAVERRVRERASHDFHSFVHSSLCHFLRERFSCMSLEEKKERLQSASVLLLIRKNVALTDGEIATFLQKTNLSPRDLHKNKNDTFLLSAMITNREVAMAINCKDAFVMECMNEMMEKFSLGFQEIFHRCPEKIVVMGGFVLAIKDVFLEMLVEHMSKRSERKEVQATLQKCIDWTLNDDLDGVIGALCAQQYHDEASRGGVTRWIDSHGSTVFELQAYTKKITTTLRTCHVFSPSNAVLRNLLAKKGGSASKVFVVTDNHVSSELAEKIRGYFQASAIPCDLYQITNAGSPSMEDVEALLLAAKTFNVGRRDYFLTVGRGATFHCGGLAAAIYRRGIPHILIPLDDSHEELSTSPHTVNVDAWIHGGSVSNFHPPKAIVFDETLNLHARQIQPSITSTLLADHYSVVFAQHLFDPRNTTLSSYLAGNPVFVVMGEAAEVIFGEKIRNYLRAHNVVYRFYVYAGGEKQKYWTQVIEIVREILMMQTSNEILICIGGGTTMDLAGFSAALTQRQYIRVPTTLLGAIDAGIGVKVGCNYKGTKNFLGDFYAPLVCINDIGFLQTVAPRDMQAGLAEILKMGIVREPKIIKIIEDHHSRLIPERFQTGKYASNLLEMATESMLRELQTNLHEDRTLLRLVDFGHAFSPFLEIKSNHRIRHGEAVSIDMAICAQIAYIQGYCTKETRDRIIHVLMAVGLPVFDDVCEAEGLLHSLKDISLARGGSLHLPIPQRVGKMIFVQQVAYDDLKRAVTYLQALHVNKGSNPHFSTMGQAYDIFSYGLLV